MLVHTCTAWVWRPAKGVGSSGPRIATLWVLGTEPGSLQSSECAWTLSQFQPKVLCSSDIFIAVTRPLRTQPKEGFFFLAHGFSSWLLDFVCLGGPSWQQECMILTSWCLGDRERGRGAQRRGKEGEKGISRIMSSDLNTSRYASHPSIFRSSPNSVTLS